MATKYSGKELEIKREIDRINRQIRQAYRKLGGESRLAQQYATLLSMGKNAPINMRGKGFEGVRYTKDNIPQISASKSAIWEFDNITAYNKALHRLGKMQTVESAQKAMIKAYETRTGQKVKKPADRKQVLELEKARYLLAEKAFESALFKLYEIEKERGFRLKAHEDLKKISRGRWTSEEDMVKMFEIAEKAINDENAEIVQDVFAQNQW